MNWKFLVELCYYTFTVYTVNLKLVFQLVFQFWLILNGKVWFAEWKVIAMLRVAAHNVYLSILIIFLKYLWWYWWILGWNHSSLYYWCLPLCWRLFTVGRKTKETKRTKETRSAKGISRHWKNASNWVTIISNYI